MSTSRILVHIAGQTDLMFNEIIGLAEELEKRGFEITKSSTVDSFPKPVEQHPIDVLTQASMDKLVDAGKCDIFVGLCSTTGIGRHAEFGAARYAGISGIHEKLATYIVGAGNNQSSHYAPVTVTQVPSIDVLLQEHLLDRNL